MSTSAMRYCLQSVVQALCPDDVPKPSGQKSLVCPWTVPVHGIGFLPKCREALSI